MQKLILMECVKFDGRRLENGNSGKTYCILRNFFFIFCFSYCRRGALLENIFQIWTENTGDQDYALRPGSTLLIPLGLPWYLARMCSSVFLLAAPTWGLKR